MDRKMKGIFAVASIVFYCSFLCELSSALHWADLPDIDLLTVTSGSTVKGWLPHKHDGINKPLCCSLSGENYICKPWRCSIPAKRIVHDGLIVEFVDHPVTHTAVNNTSTILGDHLEGEWSEVTYDGFQILFPKDLYPNTITINATSNGRPFTRPCVRCCYYGEYGHSQLGSL